MPSGLGMFMPSEIQYRNPTQYRDTLQAIGNKEATYLSQMDQFFSQLDEMKREFDITSEQRASEIEQELAFKREELSWKSSENAKDRTLKEFEIGEGSALGYDRNEVQREGQTDLRNSSAQQFGLEVSKYETIKENNAFMQGLYQKDETRKQESFEKSGKRITPSFPGSFTYGLPTNFNANSGVKGTSGYAPGTEPETFDWWNL